MSNQIVTTSQWIEARKALLDKEKELTRLRDQVAEARRALPWQRIETNYTFENETGTQSLSELFGDKNQLIIYHFMYGEGWQEGCKSCSFWADQYDVIGKHIGARDVAMAVVSHAPWQDFASFKQRMGWRFPWYSSANTTFNQDFHVSFEQPGTGFYNYHETGVGQEMPGLSVFIQEDEAIYHTYSCYGRGLDALNATYQMLDLVPKGRDEQDLSFPMAWVQLHDSY